MHLLIWQPTKCSGQIFPKWHWKYKWNCIVIRRDQTFGLYVELSVYVWWKLVHKLTAKRSESLMLWQCFVASCPGLLWRLMTLIIMENIVAPDLVGSARRLKLGHRFLCKTMAPINTKMVVGHYLADLLKQYIPLWALHSVVSFEDHSQPAGGRGFSSPLNSGIVFYSTHNALL